MQEKKVCVECHREYLTPPKVRKSILAKRKFCSKKCQIANGGKNISRQAKLFSNKACIVCSADFTPTNANQKICSPECAQKRKNIKQCPEGPWSKSCICHICNTPFKGFHNRANVCSKKCRTLAHKARRKHKGYSTRERAMKYGVEYDPSVRRTTIFKRAGWKCQACDTPTPRELMGCYDDAAPELDHIMPLSLGGGHTWDNVQCLCRSCNGIKSAGHPDVFNEAMRMFKAGL